MKTVYHICSITDNGSVGIVIEDGPVIAIGEADIRRLAQLCNLALNEIERRKTIGLVPR